MVTKEEIRQIVRDEILAALAFSLPLFAERIENSISLLSVDSNSHSGCTLPPDDPESLKLKVPSQC
jgi:hypothetical protein